MSLLFWHWWILAGVLVLGELMTFTSFLLWIAAACVITGIVKFFAPGLDWQWQLVLFSILSVVGLIAAFFTFKALKSKRLAAIEAGEDASSGLNQRANIYIGKKFILDSGIKNGSGKLEIRGISWVVHCDENLKEGSKVLVTGVDGPVLIVKPI